MGTQKLHELKVTNANPDGTVTEEDNGIYLVRLEENPGEIDFGPSVDRPLGTAVHNEGVVNLSGWGVQVGLKIKFPK